MTIRHYSFMVDGLKEVTKELKQLNINFYLLPGFPPACLPKLLASLDVGLLVTPVLKINDHATGGRRTKDILGGPKGWGPKKKVANVEIYVIFEVFAFCGGRTKTDFKDRVQTYRHLDMYGGTANDGGPGPETGSDGHAVCYEPV